jgi:hypothetical protein
MVRVLRFAMYGVCLLIVAALARGLFLRSKWEVERSITIHAEPAAIQPYVADLRRWPEWIPWSQERDPTAEFQFDGAGDGAGVGAVMNWSGKKLGRNRVTFTAVDPRAGVDFDLCLAGREDPAHGTLRLEPGAAASASNAAAATRVVWRGTGDVGWNPLNRWLLPLLEPALARDFALGLERLKQRAEAKSR